MEDIQNLTDKEYKFIEEVLGKLLWVVQVNPEVDTPDFKITREWMYELLHTRIKTQKDEGTMKLLTLVNQQLDSAVQKAKAEVLRKMNSGDTDWLNDPDRFGSI